ncbi:MAG: hypothetical protein KO316_04240 [Methanobacterium sp.]|jgi:hypothetical protein|nr:hypothetical protein [Methanobacterium sp.]
MDLKPTIWISSIDHLDEFQQILDNASTWKKMFGYDIPDGFPNMGRGPLRYFSQGEITFKNDNIIYKASSEENRFLLPYNNLKEDLLIVLNRSKIKSIEAYSQKGPFVNWKWIKITCDEDIMGGEFLICADGSDNTVNLFEMLTQFKKSQTITTNLKDFSGTKIVLLGYIGAILIATTTIIYLIHSVFIHIAGHGHLNETFIGLTVFILFFLGIILIVPEITWSTNKISQNRKIKYHFFLIGSIMCLSSMINFLISHFYQ